MKKYLVHIYIVIAFCLWNEPIASQTNKDSIPLSEQYIVFEGDTLLIELDEVFLLKTVKFRSDYDRRYYYWYRKKVLKAYPYAKLAATRLEILNERLDKIKSKRQKKEYIKIIQKYMEGEFTDQLKKLTRMEGEILIKLINRQTGESVFDLIKEYRSGWKAFWYNTTAKMFKLSLKDKYDPENVKIDYLIEDILQRAFVDGVLPYQESKLQYNFIDIERKWIEAPPPPKKKN